MQISGTGIMPFLRDLRHQILETEMITGKTDNIQLIGEMKVEETDNTQPIGTIGMVIGHLKEIIVLHRKETHLMRAVHTEIMVDHPTEAATRAEAVVEIQEGAAEATQAAAVAVIHVDKGNYMKKLFGVIAIFFLLSITGCYTVIWSPGMDFPTGDRSSEYNSNDTTGYYSGSDYSGGSNYGEVYYDEPNYGPYAGYYNIPWWYSIAPPSVSKDHNKNNGKTATTRSGDVAPIRNSGDGRGSTTSNPGEIINTPPVSSSSGSSGSTTSGSENKGNSSSENKSDNSRQSSGTGAVRNNDGGRK